MKSFLDAVRNGEKGFVVKNAVFLPFHCEIISIWIGKEMSLLATPEMIVDLSESDILWLREGDSFTNIVFKKWNDLSKELGRHKGHIILRAAEKGADIFKSENIHYIRIGFTEHQKEIFFEIIDDPYDL
ncbi:MAG: hypothetical protein HGA59_08225 [Chlorobiaceae bacterium]|jgi:hypothetical protein|nr:hypothetical protein [Chlorobiaceae bacterium]